MPLKILVTGYPRGATRWAYRVLKAVGCDVGFCSVFTEDSSSQYTYKAVDEASHDIEVSWFGAPFTRHPALQDVKIVRLERHPLLVARSLVWLGVFSPAHNTYMKEWHRVMSRYVSKLKGEYGDCPEEASLYFVCEWADKILELSEHEDTCVKVEDGENSLIGACGGDRASLAGSISPCNASGCSVSGDMTGITDSNVVSNMRRLLEDRKYANMSGEERAWLGAYSNGPYVPSGV